MPSVNDTVRVKVTFNSWSDGDEQVPDDPDSVVVNILDSDGDVLSTDSPTPSGDYATYYYDWTPTSEGTFTVQFVGTFSDDSVDVVPVEFTVGGPETVTTLGIDYEISFAAGLSPLYLDPEDFLPLFPDARAIEIATFIKLYSEEMDLLFAGKDLTNTAYDYIRAATACALSRVYSEGEGNESSFALGDLQVTTRNTPKTSVNRANATTWCELAAVLRSEMYRGRAGMKPVVKGSNFENPMPIRTLKTILD